MTSNPTNSSGVAEPAAVTYETLRIGARYNWKNQPERLVYMGLCEPRNGRWHQFAKVDAPTIVWCEVRDDDLSSFEETPAAASQAASHSAPEPVALMELIEQYAEARHKHGAPEYNAVSREARKRVLAVLGAESKACASAETVAWTQPMVDKAHELASELCDAPPCDEWWSGWACQYPGKLPRLYGAREIAEVNLDEENGDRLLFVKEFPHD